MVPNIVHHILQKRREREIQQQMESRDEETLELKETYSSLQQEVDIKTKKLKKVKRKFFHVHWVRNKTNLCVKLRGPLASYDFSSCCLFQLFSKLQAVKAEIHDLQEEHIKERQELEQTQNELTRELKLK